MAGRVAVLMMHTSPAARPGGAKAGGMNVYVTELSKEMARAGWEVDIFSRKTSAATPHVAEIEPRLRVVHVDAGPPEPLPPEALRDYVDDFADAVEAFAAAEGARYDLVHSHYWLAGLAGLRLQERWSVPHATMFHTLGEVKNRASLSENEPLMRISAEAEIVGGADRIVCATELEKSQLVHLYGAEPDRVEVVPLGVDIERFRPLDKEQARRELGFEDERIILFVGRLEPLKGVDILINAAAMLESDVECSVLIVGGDESSTAQMTQLKGLASDLGIGHRVAFIGAVDHEKLPLFYNAADVCVVPSHYESFGLVAVEAMACGVPVVASRVGGLTGTVKDGETGYLVPWLCPEPFAERIEMLLENESLRRNLGEAAREAVARFRWGNVAARILQVYDALLQEGTPAPVSTA
ncbi:MAG TPA: glycosyltransferase [Dehalococcoidia bacterium]|nr:glycosyltransferase [Dehalococcoidia bacterium]